jgi:hypothetical protein
MKFHLSLNVSDIGHSVAFYEKVFGPPAKHRADYAKFEVADPPLVLSLEPTPPAGRGSLNHVGLRLADTEALVEMQRRLEMAGLRSEREEGVECCYAKQTKFWLHSPDGVLWEFYVLQGDIAHRGVGQVPEKIGADGHASSHALPVTPSPASRSWEHRMTEPFPASLPFEDGTLSEVNLRGTFNTPDGEARRDAILAEAMRALAPGGRVALHVLTADRPMDAAPSLPGPAAAVKAVPTDADLLASLERAGFVGVRLTKFGPNPCFRLNGAEMRETMAEAFAPAAEDAGAVLVVYRGPFREVTDDAGRVYRRGERVRVPAAEWARLSKSLPVDAFTRLAEPETAALACGAK